MRLAALALAVALLPAAAPAGEAPAKPAPAAPPAAARPAAASVVLPVKGMSCGCCTGRVTRALEAVPGVEKAEVTLDPGQARVAYDPAKVQVAALVKAIVDEGFEAAAP